MLAIVGESGSGKSVTSLSVMGLLQAPGRVVAGEVLYRGRTCSSSPKREMREHPRQPDLDDLPGADDEPEPGLHRSRTSSTESIRTHMKLDRKAALERAIEMLALVGIPSPEKRIKDYPHQMSGGMRQRVMIAMALSCDPQLLIADEPTTALDVTIQAQILALHRRPARQDRHGGAAHHARPRRGRRDRRPRRRHVLRPRRRGGDRRAALRAAAAPVHARPARVDPDAWRTPTTTSRST